MLQTEHCTVIKNADGGVRIAERLTGIKSMLLDCPDARISRRMRENFPHKWKSIRSVCVIPAIFAIFFVGIASAKEFYK